MLILQNSREKKQMRSLQEILRVVRLISIALMLSAVLISSPYLLAYEESSNAHVFINPPMYIASEMGEIFNITVDITEVEKLHSYELRITYNTSMLDILQVIPGDFFPQQASFQFALNESLGSVIVSMSILDPSNSLNGSGTLVQFTFEVILVPSACAVSIIKLDHIQLFDPNSSEIDHSSVSGLYFWKSTLPDPPVGGYIDLHTQKGGWGPNVIGGIFVLGELVNLTSDVTYNGWPIQRALVAFQVQNPLNQTAIIRTVQTNEEGSSRISFRIPDKSDSLGYWLAISIVEVDGEIVWDVTIFHVITKFIPVGGTSFQINEHETAYLLKAHIIVIAISVFLTLLRRKKWRQKKRNLSKVLFA